MGVLIPPLLVVKVRGGLERSPPKITDLGFAQRVVFRVTTDTLNDQLLILNLKDNDLHVPIFEGHVVCSHVRLVHPHLPADTRADSNEANRVKTGFYGTFSNHFS